MKFRTHQIHKRLVVLQAATEPSERDPMVCVANSPAGASMICDALNDYINARPGETETARQANRDQAAANLLLLARETPPPTAG